jgi:hypothetical protein
MSTPAERLRALIAERDAQFYKDQDECECNGCNAWAKSTPGSDERILALESSRFDQIVALYRTHGDALALRRQREETT